MSCVSDLREISPPRVPDPGRSRGILGILGGMGPAATADFYTRLVDITPAKCDQDHVPTIIWSDTAMPDRSAAILSRARESPEERLCAGAKFLEAAGATVIAIPCNTAHHWHERIQSQVRIPVLHVAEASLKEIRRAGYRRPMLLGTSGLLATGLYQSVFKNSGITLSLPLGSFQQHVDRAIRSIKAGDPERAVVVLNFAFSRGDFDGDSVLLACTELPLIARSLDVRLRLVSTTECLAKAAAECFQR